MNCGCGGTGWNSWNNSPCGCGCKPACPPVVNFCGTNSLNLVGALVVQNSFAMPACDTTAVLNIPNLKAALIGGYIWNPVYGYLKITSFDAVLKQLTVENDCQVGNVDAGTIIPACTPFQITDATGPTFFNTWQDFSSLFGQFSGSGAMTITGVTVTDAKYKITDVDLVDFYAEANFTIGGTPDQYIYSKLPLAAKVTLYNLVSTSHISDGDGTLLNYPSIDIYPTTSDIRFAVSHTPANWTVGASALIRLAGRYRKG